MIEGRPPFWLAITDIHAPQPGAPPDSYVSNVDLISAPLPGRCVGNDRSVGIGDLEQDSAAPAGCRDQRRDGAKPTGDGEIEGAAVRARGAAEVRPLS